MKTKIPIICLIFFIMTGAISYGNSFFEFSLGFSTPGIGMSFLRGNGAKELKDSIEGDIKRSTLSYAPMVQLDMMFEFFSFLGIETGLGYTYSRFSYVDKTDGSDTSLRFIRNEITIPLALRLQFETKRINLYLAGGFKFGIPISDNYTTQIINGVETTFDDYTKFTTYATFALGLEVRYLQQII